MLAKLRVALNCDFPKGGFHSTKLGDAPCSKHVCHPCMHRKDSSSLACSEEMELLGRACSFSKAFCVIWVRRKHLHLHVNVCMNGNMYIYMLYVYICACMYEYTHIYVYSLTPAPLLQFHRLCIMSNNCKKLCHSNTKNRNKRSQITKYSLPWSPCSGVSSSFELCVSISMLCIHITYVCTQMQIHIISILDLCVLGTLNSPGDEIQKHH